MRILIVGGDGMQGHQLPEQFKDRHETAITLRQQLDAHQSFPRLLDCADVYPGVDVRHHFCLAGR